MREKERKQGITLMLLFYHYYSSQLKSSLLSLKEDDIKTANRHKLIYTVYLMIACICASVSWKDVEKPVGVGELVLFIYVFYDFEIIYFFNVRINIIGSF